MFCFALFLLSTARVSSQSHFKTPPATIAGKADALAPNIDPRVSPSVDIFEYANGTWLKHHPIPASESSWGIGNVVDEEINNQLRKVNETASAKESKAGTDEQKIGDFWKTGMDEKKADALGLQPLKPMLDKIDAISTTQDAIDVAFEMQKIEVGAFFNSGVGQDEKNSDSMEFHLEQGGLGLPNKDFYFNPEPGVAKIRTEYMKYVTKLLALAGDTDPSSAANVIAFETSLAKSSRKMEDLRDPESNYHRIAPDEITTKYTPTIDWKSRLEALKVKPKFLIVGQPEFFTGLEAVLTSTPVPTLKSYLRSHLVGSYAPYLNKEAQDINFQFEGQVLSGQKVEKPGWKRVLRSENQSIGFILGRIYVKKYFPPTAKARYSNLVEAIRNAYSARIDKLTWMSPETKKKAHIKLAAITKKVGYPDKWKDYSKLTIGTDSYCANMMAAAKWRFEDELSKYGKPVDRKEWEMTPQTYNAYYNPSNNEIVLPAAMFTIPGFKDSQLDDAVIYGYAAASTIGHEMTHGFDDEGRQFDPHGNLKDWWTKEDAAKFKKRADVLAKQFDAYEPIKGLHIKGEAGLGENLADYGGVLLGLDAFKKTKQYKDGKKIAGFTPLQRYFLGYALSWMEEERTQVLRRQLLSDVHSPAKWRVIGPLSNVPDFFAAFDIKPGSPMRRPADKIVHVW